VPYTKADISARTIATAQVYQQRVDSTNRIEREADGR
jgi:hypothetical protein